MLLAERGPRILQFLQQCSSHGRWCFAARGLIPTAVGASRPAAMMSPKAMQAVGALRPAVRKSLKANRNSVDTYCTSAVDSRVVKRKTVRAASISSPCPVRARARAIPTGPNGTHSSADRSIRDPNQPPQSGADPARREPYGEPKNHTRFYRLSAVGAREPRFSRLLG